jgi:hypothetical protein
MKTIIPTTVFKKWINPILRIGVFVCILLTTTQSRVASDDDLHAQITFENGYHNDTVSVSINDSLIGKGFIVLSDDAKRVSPFKIMVKKTANGLIATNTLSSATVTIPNNGDELKIELLVNTYKSVLNVNLTIGKYVGIQKFRKDVIVTNQNYVEKKYD